MDNAAGHEERVDVEGVRANLRTWRAIAQGFDATRARPWAPVAEFLAALPGGSRVLDAGCGNGRHLVVAVERRLVAHGLDLSPPLLQAARRRAPRAKLCHGLLERPPFRDASFDAVLCVAAMHHVRGASSRLHAWTALGRLVRPGGRLLATVWALDQPRFRDRPPAPPPGRHEPGDALVGWSRDGVEEQRFVHLYKGGELSRELTEGGWDVESESGIALGGSEADNFVAWARRPEPL